MHAYDFCIQKIYRLQQRLNLQPLAYETGTLPPSHWSRLFEIMRSVAVIRSFEHHTCGSTIWLGPTPILRENTLGWSGATHLSPHERGFAARRLFRVVPCCEGTMQLQAFIPSPGFEPRPYSTATSLTTIPNG
ncbi:hypothetical protein TNCV_4287571 [Trichonephila clavipes]|uniref:Uncharacterized protein n=1 Tax=Trichonephila clavipes TaxID=2585209 RepID=A0A8X6SG66_TRICX|nr:hypothetical protein TNCV_4287571 [Trichonephila clavipes]